MKRMDTSKPFAFFLEFLLVLFFFALSAMIVLRIYAQAQTMHTKDQQSLQALAYARNAIARPENLEPGRYGLDPEMEKEGTYYQVVIEQDEDGKGTYQILHEDTVLVSLRYYAGGQEE